MTKTLLLTRGLTATIDDADYEKTSRYRWRCNISGSGYRHAVARINDRSVYLHRFIMSPPDDMVVDHIDGDGLNNCRANLRVVTAAQNHFNRALNCNSASGFTGVYLKKGRGYWCAEIEANGVRRYLGSFPTRELAAAARQAAELEVFGGMARRRQA